MIRDDTRIGLIVWRWTRYKGDKHFEPDVGRRFRNGWTAISRVQLPWWCRFRFSTHRLERVQPLGRLELSLISKNGVSKTTVDDEERLLPRPFLSPLPEKEARAQAENVKVFMCALGSYVLLVDDNAPPWLSQQRARALKVADKAANHSARTRGKPNAAEEDQRQATAFTTPYDESF